MSCHSYPYNPYCWYPYHANGQCYPLYDHKHHNHQHKYYNHQHKHYNDQNKHNNDQNKHNEYNKKSNVVNIVNNITTNTTWKNDKTYVICSEIHVRQGAKLCIENNTTVLFKECPLPGVGIGGVPYAVLVIDSGASIQASYVKFTSANGGVNNTGGLIICGTNANMMYGAYATIRSYSNVTPGNSKLSCCSFSNLGNKSTGLNSLTFLQVKDYAEVMVSNLSVNQSGNIGWLIYGGNHNIDNLTILRSLNANISLLNGSSLTVSKNISLINNVNGQQPLATDVVGPPLVGVIGFDVLAVNTLTVLPGAEVYMLGLLVYDDGQIDFSGIFAGYTPGSAGIWDGASSEVSSIKGQSP